MNLTSMRVIISNIRDLLRRILSPRLFQFVRFRWWCLSFYFPRLVTSWFVKNTPEVRGFDGSDKGHGSHNYTTVYSALFKGCHDQPLRIFELGLGTNNPGLPSNIGVYGLPGASLRGWRELFPHALVYGADIDRDILFQEDRIRTFYCDQLDQASIRQLWSQPDLQGGMDIIVEDGLHSIEASFSFLDGSLEQLRPGGVYVVEDISQNLVDEWYDRLETIYSKRYSNYEFAFALLPNSTNSFYNNLLIIRRDRGDERRPVQVHELSEVS
jgi:hypothetical protein